MKIIITVFCFISANLGSAQINQWTWTKGSENTTHYGVYGTKGVPSINNSPGSRTNAATSVDASGNLWLYGGYGLAASAFGNLNDLWKYNIVTNEWTWMRGDSIINVLPIFGTQGVSTATNDPGARLAGMSWTDATGNLWILGGATAPTTGSFNDLWKYSPATNEWTWMKGDQIRNVPGVYGTMGVSSPLNKPGGRGDASAWTDAAGNLWLFGGVGIALGTIQVPLNDLWKYSPVTNEWTWVNGTNLERMPGVFGTQGVPSATNMPGGKSRYASWKDALNNLWLFGGYNYNPLGNYVASNELWKYNIPSNQWTWVGGDTIGNTYGVYGNRGISAATNWPGSRTSFVTWSDIDGNFWLFGGYGFSANYNSNLNDLWKYSPSNNEWTWIKGDTIEYPLPFFGNQGVSSPLNTPGNKQYSFGWTDHVGNFWLFGGVGSDASGLNGYMADLWKYTLANTLPVKLISFNGIRDNEIAKLYWQVENEINFERYEIERSFDDVNYDKISYVKATNQMHYSYNDNSKEFLGHRVFYRLKMVDVDNKYAYSKIIALDFTDYGNITVSPNPATTEIKIKINGNIQGRIYVSIINSTGMVIKKASYTYSGQDIIIPTSGLSSGNYVIKVENKGRQYSTRLVIVN